MVAKPEQLVDRWLRSMGIDISSSLLREKLITHPDYPSLLSVTDTLDGLGIDNAALIIDKERLNEAPVPFLAHYAVKGEFIIINNIVKQIQSNPDFEKNWNGTALLAEKPDNWQHAENLERLVKENKRKQTILFTLFSVVTLAGLCLINNLSWQLTGLLITTFTGLTVAVLIVQHELGISNELTEQLCSAGKHTDCDAVMHSKGSRFSKWLNWADAGIIYFASYSLLLVILLYTGNTGDIVLLAVLSCAAVPFTMFSLYYQWQVVKKWCTLCLLTVAVLWLQFTLLIPVTLSLLKSEFNNISFNAISFTAFIFSLVVASWLLIIKPTLQRNNELTDTSFSLLRFKYNPAIFEALLKKQRQVNITPFDNDVQLGNPDALLQVVVACSPYCGPCARAHEVLHGLLCNNDFGLTVRFTAKANNKEDKRTEAVSYLLKLMEGKKPGYKKQVLHDWYALMNLEKFREKYPMQNEADLQLQLEEHDRWSTEAKIEFTPTIFINGYQLPKQYNASDIKKLLRGIININEAKDETFAVNNISLV